jgi:ribose 5-phosphate isomerase B
MNIICLGGRVMGTMVAWDLVETFLAAEFSQAERHLRRLSKVAALERNAFGEVGAQASAIPA